MPARPDSWVESAPDEDERARRQFMQHTPAEAMQRALEQLERDYGTVEAYLLHAGLDEARIERLRRAAPPYLKEPRGAGRKVPPP